MNSVRLKIADLARKLYKKEISFSDFLNETPEQDRDELIDELVDMIEHEPQKGGLFGVSEKEHEKYIESVFKLIARLENEST